MVFTDVIFADGAFHTLKTVINEKPSALPRDSVQFDDNPVINLVGLICGRLAGGNGRLVAVGCRRDLDVLLVNDEGRQRILGAGYGSWPVAIRYREGVFEVFVVKDPLVWIKYRFDADLNETDDPVLLDVPPDAPPHVGILDLIEDQDEAIWSRSEIDLTYLRSDDGIGNAKLAGWMTRGAWTVGLSTLGQPVAVNMGDGRAYLLAGPVTTGMPPREIGRAHV